ncbi:hypothetical protein Bbelb_172170 [Branchiostoma belcheri]|nr:hypothetical protein Bbelb_172170 [Branchiostoma belcheri]
MTRTELSIPGYILFTNAESDGVRGAAVHVKNDINAMTPDKVDQESFTEVIPVEVKLNQHDRLLIMGIYRSPNSTTENNERLNKLIQNCGTWGYSHMLIVGDFNYPTITWSEGGGTTRTNESEAGRFLEATRDAYLFQHVTFPTRHQLHQESKTLDLIFTNEGGMIAEIDARPPVGKSDHIVMSFTFKCYAERTNTSTNTYQYHKGNYTKMKEELSEDWEKKLNNLNVEECWEVFSHKVKTAVEENIPKTNQPSKRRGHLAWRDSDTTLKLRRKQKAWKKYSKTRTHEDHAKYAKARNQARWATRKALRNFEKDLAKNIKMNTKLFWKYVNTKTKTRECIPDLVDDTHEDHTFVATNDDEKAEVLNKFFVSTFTKENTQSIPEPTQRMYEEDLNNINISVEDVCRRLKNLNPNKSPGPDNIHPRVLKEMAEVLATPLQIIFTKSLEEGKLPREWKIGHITPIFKKGSKKSPSNYRPVSLTSVTGKVLEGIVRDQIVDHMKSNELFTKHQHGFLPGRSTVTQILECLEDWTESLDGGEPTDVIYLDFRKAFDSVPIQRLLTKIASYGIKGKLLQWIASFLSDRKQRVCVNGALSSWAEVTSGVPQGSVLGPVLFTVFVNDMPEAVTNQLKLFADDTKMYCPVTQEKHCEELQANLYKLEEWSTKWQLCFHPDKCTVLRIGSGHPPYIYTMKGKSGLIPLKFTTEEKDLGIIVDRDLSFEKHIAKMTAKANQLTGLLWRTFEYIDTEVFLLLYKSLIRPHLEYGAPVWSPHQWKQADQIENVQRRASKRVPGLNNLPYEERLKVLRLPTLVYRRIRGDMIMTYKYIHGKLDTEGCLPKMQEKTRTRGNSLRLNKRSVKNNKRLFFYSNRVVTWWNSLPEEVVSAPSVNSFKNRLDKHMRSHPVVYNPRALDNPHKMTMSTQ